ncbi:putative ribonuclease H-like domain-containing protein [Tanacetum coccineum]
MTGGLVVDLVMAVKPRGATQVVTRGYLMINCKDDRSVRGSGSEGLVRGSEGSTSADYPNMPNLEEIAYTNDDEDVGAEADMTNLDTHIPVSPILTTKIHKDRPLSATEDQPQRFSELYVCLFSIRAIGTKWIYKNKKDERGIVVRNKARIEAIRLFLAYASFKDFVVYQMDVKSAFLYGKIEEEVYVCQPAGFEDLEFPDRVYKVEKALYGLHQAPRAWYETLSTYLLDNGI